MQRSIAVLVCFAGIAASSAQAAVPHRLQVQGRLTNLAAQPVADGKYTMTLDILATESSNPMYSEIQVSVDVTDGLFATTVGEAGAGLPMAVLVAAPELWVRVAVDGEPALPAQRMSAIPYALMADHAQVAAAVSPQGSGSLLDADLLDGKDLSEILTGTATEAKQDQILAALAPLAVQSSVATLASDLAALASASATTTQQESALTKLDALATTLTTVGTVAKQDQILTQLAALALAVKTLGPRNYSKTCADFADRGWPSKSECLADGRWHFAGQLGTIIANGDYGLLNEYEIGSSVTNGGAIVLSSYSNFNCMFSITQSISGAVSDVGDSSYYNVAYWGSGAGCPNSFVGRYAYYDDHAGQSPLLTSSGGTVSDAANWAIWVRK